MKKVRKNKDFSDLFYMSTNFEMEASEVIFLCINRDS